MPPDSSISPEQLLVHSAWLRRLARTLVGEAGADDLVQDTWSAALRHPPDTSRPLRPWLATVARNLARMSWRSGTSRGRREADVDVPEPPASPEDVLARAETQHRLVALVLGMPEPYRATLLLRYFEDLESSEIARRQDVPPGTVRWRLKEALDRLRAQLDAETAGGRRSWLVTLGPIAKGAVVAKTSSKVLGIVVMLVLLMLAGGGAAWMHLREGGASEGSSAADVRVTGSKPRAARPGEVGESELGVLAADASIAPRIVAGIVTYRREPVAGATVHLTSAFAALGVGPDLVAVTDAAGHFAFDPQPARELQVVASAPGRTSAGLIVDLADTAKGSDRLELRLRACDLGIGGLVTDAAGGPIAGAHVRRFDDIGATRLTGDATSAADGRYQLCVPGGLFSVIVEADGYGARFLLLQVEQGHEARDFVLTPEAVVAGQVVHEGGAPATGALVMVAPAEGARDKAAERWARTDSDGRFRVVGLAPGKLRLSAIAPGAVTEASVSLALAAGETRELTVVVKSRARLTGVVVEDGKPVSGAHVQALGKNGTWSESANTRADGRFAIDRVSFGEIRLETSPFEVVTPTSLRVGPGPTADVVVEVRPMASLAGQVTAGGVPASDVEVNLSSPDMFEVLRTDADGRFERRGLPPARYALSPTSHALGAGGDTVTVDLARGQRKGDVVLDLGMRSTIAGRVLDQQGAPVVGALVTWTRRDGNDQGSSPTDADGRYRAWAMAGGDRYTALVRAGPGSEVILPAAHGSLPGIVVASADTHIEGVDLVVQVSRRAIAGRVIDDSGAPVADVLVQGVSRTSMAADFGVWRQPARSVTGTDGAFHLDGLIENAYVLRAHAPDGAEVLTADIAAGRTDVVLRLAKPGSIQGVVTGFRHMPDVFANRSSEETDTSDSPGADGRFALRGLAPGRYHVVALGEDGEAAAVSVDLTAGAVAHVTLSSAGTAVVEGRVLDFITGAPLAGVACTVRASLGDERPIPYWRGPREPSDALGRWHSDNAPSGAVEVACDPDASGLYTGGAVATSLPAGKTTAIDVPVVRLRQPPAPPAWIGVTPVVSVYAARVLDVERDGPGAAAGLLPGDVIVSVDGRDVSALAVDGVGALLVDHPLGTTVQVRVQRGGAARELTLKLGKRPEASSSGW